VKIVSNKQGKDPITGATLTQQTTAKINHFLNKKHGFLKFKPHFVFRQCHQRKTGG
jgi:hypothetical protein